MNYTGIGFGCTKTQSGRPPHLAAPHFGRISSRD
jgi:hypothetical protein